VKWIDCAVTMLYFETHRFIGYYMLQTFQIARILRALPHTHARSTRWWFGLISRKSSKGRVPVTREEGAVPVAQESAIILCVFLYVFVYVRFLAA
jgi:hypothetical protein